MQEKAKSSLSDKKGKIIRSVFCVVVVAVIAKKSYLVKCKKKLKWSGKEAICESIWKKQKRDCIGDGGKRRQERTNKYRRGTKMRLDG